MQNQLKKWLGRAVLAGLLCSLTLTTAQAAKISRLRGGVKDTRARIVMDVDEPVRYRAETSGKKLIIALEGSTDRTQTVRVRDARIREAVLEPVGKKSRLVVTFRGAVPDNYKIFLLKKPGRSIHGLLDRSVSDSQAEASVRDGISSIEVLVLKLYEDGSVGLMNGTKLSADITDEECELISSQRLRLPCRFSYNIDRTIGELENTSRQYAMSWNKHCLFKDQLILFFNENNESDLADYHLKYDFVSGLICEKRSGEVE